MKQYACLRYEREYQYKQAYTTQCRDLHRKNGMTRRAQPTNEEKKLREEKTYQIFYV